MVQESKSPVNVLPYAGGRWGFRFCGFGEILDRFFGFRTQTLRFFGFGIFCGLRFLAFLSIGFRFSAKILAVFRIWYKIWFSVFLFRFPDLFGNFDLNCAPQPCVKTLPVFSPLHKKGDAVHNCFLTFSKTFRFCESENLMVSLFC